MPQLVDKERVSITSRVVDDRGYLRAPATLARVGIQKYLAHELGLQDRDAQAIVLAFTPEDEVFKPESMSSFAGVPVTDDHPPENVTAKNYRSFSVGWVGDEIKRDGDHIAGMLTIADSEVVTKVNAGKVEISNGYGCRIDATPGEWNGQKYDVVKRDLRGNHVALVDAGRCGGTCRIMDGATCSECGGAGDSASCNCHGGNEMSTQPGPQGPQLVQRIVDGITVEVTTQGAQVIDKLQTQLTDAAAAKTEAERLLAEEKAAHVKTTETKDGELAGLKSQLTDTALDSRIQERADMLDGVRTLLGKDYDGKGKTNLQMMQDAVSKVMGPESIADKSEDYVKGLYGAISSKKVTNVAGVQDSVRHAVLDGHQQQQVQDGGKPRGREAYLARLQAGPISAANGK